MSRPMVDAGIEKQRLTGISVAVLGGDERELHLLRALLGDGATVHAVGFGDRIRAEGLNEFLDLTCTDDYIKAIQSSMIVIAPMSNTDAEGSIRCQFEPSMSIVLNDEVFQTIGPDKPLLIGMAKPIIERLAAKHRVSLVQVADVDEIAILNSVPTAEGAIQRAMEELPVTLHGTRAVVVGFGRCGMTLARMLHGIGAKVTVVARDPGQLARAYEQGLDTVDLDDLHDVAAKARVLFNTVPARVITKDVLEPMRSDAIIIDVASSPGGTDFNYARERGLRAFLELGIPGKVAPETAGAILARTVPKLIVQMIINNAPRTP